jgi:hypothetical protein
MTSVDGISWVGRNTSPVAERPWQSICWSSELKIFVAVSNSNLTISNKVMTSHNGIDWISSPDPIADATPMSFVCWSSKLGLFFACAGSNTGQYGIIYSNNGINWFSTYKFDFNSYDSISYSPELNSVISVASAVFPATNQRLITSVDALNYIEIDVGTLALRSSCWCPELGIFVALDGTNSTNTSVTTLNKNRIPTAYNVFNSSFNSIDSNGNWTLQQILKSQTFVDTTSSLHVFGLNLCYISNTSSTTITDLTGGTNRQELLLYFEDDNTTIENNSNIKLNGGINFNGTTFDTLKLLYTGTIWVELCRSVNS